MVVEIKASFRYNKPAEVHKMVSNSQSGEIIPRCRIVQATVYAALSGAAGQLSSIGRAYRL